MARVAHVMSKTRNRSHIPLISQLKSLNKKPPLKLPRFRNVLYLIPPLLPEAIRCSVYISTHSALTRAHGSASVVRAQNREGAAPQYVPAKATARRRCDRMSSFCRAARNVQQAQQARDELRRVVGFSAADEIQKLDGLKKAGSISDAEFARLRARLIQ
jgi:hypothetical protein